MLGVRPEHMQLAFERGVRAGVDSVEYLGGDSLVGCRIGGASASRCASPGSVGLARGDADVAALGARRAALFRCRRLRARDPSRTSCRRRMIA